MTHSRDHVDVDVQDVSEKELDELLERSGSPERATVEVDDL